MFARTPGIVAVLVALLLAIAPLRAEEAKPPTVIVVDSSGSMAAALEGATRLDAARDVLAELLAGWPADAPLGLIAYGHRRTGDCRDIEVLAPIGPPDAALLTKRLTDLRARGKTPLADSLRAAAALLREAGAGGSILLVSDGIETCDPDPCGLAAELQSSGITVHVVGFAVDAEAGAQLACIADAGGGRYGSAEDAAGLLTSLGEASAEATGQLEPEPQPEPEPDPTPPVEPEVAKPMAIGFIAVVAGTQTPLELPVAWRIASRDPALPFDYAGGGRGLSLELLPGDYSVEAQAANAVATLDFTVAAEPLQVVVPLPVGALTARAVPWTGAPALGEGEGLAWSLEPLQGQLPAAVPGGARPSWVLAAGRYRLAVTRAGLTAATEVAVESGGKHDLELSFRLGELALSAALAADQPPLTDWRGLVWRVLRPDGTVADTAPQSAQPLFRLQAGDYQAELAVAGAVLTQPVTVREGEREEALLLVPTGTRVLTAALAASAPIFDDWRDAYWTVSAVEVVGLDPATPQVEQIPQSQPELQLLPGRWHILVESGRARGEREIVVTPDSVETLRLDLDAGRLTLIGNPPAGAERSMNIVFEVAPLAADGSEGERIALGGSSESMSDILPAGKWRIFLSDSDYRTATADVDLPAGAEITLEMELK